MQNTGLLVRQMTHLWIQPIGFLAMATPCTASTWGLMLPLLTASLSVLHDEHKFGGSEGQGCC